jgi:hypothetical protein
MLIMLMSEAFILSFSHPFLSNYALYRAVLFIIFIYFPLLHVVQTGSGALQASYPMSTGGSYPGGKVARA